MSTRRQLFYALAVFTLSLLFGEALAKLDTADNAITNLYDSLLQREYAGPVLFPNHQVERKAQRSPSLRLRFGRSDPDMMPSAQKRWFGDVNQKPIRSPSLRLRFGRRSDPSMPMHSSFDELMNNNGDVIGNGNDAVAAAVAQNAVNDYDEDFDVTAFERVLRKPQRLRWGRSVSYESDNQGGNFLDEEQNERQRTDDYFNALLNTEKLRNMLLALRNYDEATRDNESAAEFQREVRKPGPLRLRWGRSTGGRTQAAVVESSEKKLTPETQAQVQENAENNAINKA